MKEFKFRAVMDFFDSEEEKIRTTGEFFTVNSDDRAYALLNKPEENKVVELYEIRHKK